MSSAVPTVTQQRSDVGQGLALGCLVLGIESISSDSTKVDFAFIHAWSDWSQARRFPAIRASHARNEIRGIIAKSQRRNWFLAAWEQERRLHPYLVDGWSIEDAAEINQQSTGVTLDQWTSLAQAFTTPLEAEFVETPI